ncbi:MAG: hypothetical protein PSX36_14220 [bacterium]|nr:hypothetical protein [bacterium]
MSQSKSIIVYTTLAVMLAMGVACTKEVGKLKPTATLLCDTINYTQDVEPIIAKNCLGCHGVTPVMSPPIPLTSYQEVVTQAENGEIYKYVIQGSPYFMPKGSTGGLPQNEKDLINCWLQNGYKKN